MFPELPTCSPFANKIPRFKPGLSWNALPSSSESVYPEITVSTARPATEEIVDVFSADTHFNCCLSRSVFVPELLCISPSISRRKTYYSRRWPFLSSCLRLHFLATRCLVQNKNQDASREDCACPEVGGFWPSNIVFTVTPLGKKNDRGLQMEAEQ